MPAKDRLGHDAEQCHSSRGMWRASAPMSAQSDQVKRGQVEYGELVAQHEDPGFLCDRVHPVDMDRCKDAADEAVED